MPDLWILGERREQALDRFQLHVDICPSQPDLLYPFGQY